MGVAGLTTFLKDNRASLAQSITVNRVVTARDLHSDHRYGDEGHAHPAASSSRNDVDIKNGHEEVQEEPLRLVIDGWAFIYAAYTPYLPWTTGGEYLAFAKLVKRLLLAWKALGVQCYFVFDGPTPAWKHELVLARMQGSPKISQEFFATSVQARSHPRFLAHDGILPPFCFDVFNDTARELGYTEGRDLFYLVEGEADGPCVALAQDLGAYVLGNDSDFAIFGFGGAHGYKGFLPLELVGWQVQIRTPTQEGKPAEPDSGFQTAQSRRNRRQRQNQAPGMIVSHGLIPPDLQSDLESSTDTSFSLTFTGTFFTPEALASRLRIPRTYLPLLASIVGTDHSPANAPNLFFPRSLKRSERIDQVALAIRESLAPGAKSRLSKRKKAYLNATVRSSPTASPTLTPSGSAATSVNGDLTQEDSAFAFLSLVVTSLLLGPLNTEAEMHKLVSELIEATCHYIPPFSPMSDLRCCAGHPFCDHLKPVPAGRRGVWTEDIRRLASRAREAGYFRNFSNYIHPDRTYHHSAFEHYQGPCLRQFELHRSLRSLGWQVLLTGVGFHKLEEAEEASRNPVEPESPTPDQDAPLSAPADAEAGVLPEHAFDSNSQSPETEEIILWKPASENTDETVSKEPSYKIVEWSRVDGSLSIRSRELPINHTDLIGPTGAPIALSSHDVKWGFWLKALHSDNSKTLQLPNQWQPLVAMIRFAILALPSKGATKNWTSKDVVHCITAGMMSYNSWNHQGPLNDESRDSPLLETKSCDIMARMSAVAQDAQLLGQALFLLGSPEERSDRALYRYLDGRIWHSEVGSQRRDRSSTDPEAKVRQELFLAVSEGIEDRVLGLQVQAQPTSSGQQKTSKSTSSQKQRKMENSNSVISNRFADLQQ